MPAKPRLSVIRGDDATPTPRHTPRQTRPTSSRKPAPWYRQASVRRYAPAMGVGAIYTGLTAVSIVDQSEGIALATHCAAWKAIMLAVSVDIGLTALKGAIVATKGSARKQVERAATAPIVGVLMINGALNAKALSSHSATWSLDWLIGVGLGLGITAMLFACLHVIDVLVNRK